MVCRFYERYNALSTVSLISRVPTRWQEWVTALDMAEVGAEHTIAASVNAGKPPSVGEPDHFVGETAPLEEFERTRLGRPWHAMSRPALYTCR
jgi:hypothetical protein